MSFQGRYRFKHGNAIFKQLDISPETVDNNPFNQLPVFRQAARGGACVQAGVYVGWEAGMCVRYVCGKRQSRRRGQTGGQVCVCEPGCVNECVCASACVCVMVLCVCVCVCVCTRACVCGPVCVN